MNSRRERLIFSLGLGLLMYLIAAPSHAVVIVDDSWADGDLAKTGALDTDWYTSTSSSADEVGVGFMGLVTGTSGRGLHTTFPTQSLTNVGDAIKVSWTFTTPDTVGSGRGSALRFGLFDNLGRLTANNPGIDPADSQTDTCCLDAAINASSSNQNAVYGWGIANGGPGTEIIPGYMLTMDVNNDADDDDMTFRRHNGEFATITGTGRGMSTTDGFVNLGSGPDDGFGFEPNTEYSGMYTIGRFSPTELGLRFDLVTPQGSFKHIDIDDGFDSVDFGYFGVHVNSRTFGSSNTADEPDNGVDFTNVKIEFLTGRVVPEPTALALLMGAFVVLPAMRRR